jgi:hypothetical protein
MLKKAMFVAALAGAGVAFQPGQAVAQSNVCQQLQPLLQQREALLRRANSLGRRNVDPAVACRVFSDLAANGARTIAFVNANKDWCQIPDEFANGLRGSQGQITRVRGQACGAAQQRTKLLAQARRQQQQAQQQGGAGQSTFGGVDGFSSGPWRVPQGAL